MTNETEQTPLPKTQSVADPHLIYYAKLGGEFVQNISRQLETNDLVATIHHFDGQNRDSFRKWRKDLCRAALENNPVDDLYMRKLVSRTVKDTASDFWSEIRTQNPAITWAEIQTAFDNRFRTFVDAQLAKQKLPRLRQEKRETLHSFAQRIVDTAREAYTDTQIGSEVVSDIMREIFLNGMIDLKSSQRIIRESPKDLTTALDSAIKEEMLNESFKIRRTTLDSEGRRIIPMEIITRQYNISLYSTIQEGSLQGLGQHKSAQRNQDYSAAKKAASKAKDNTRALTDRRIIQQPRRPPPRLRTGARRNDLEHRPAPLGNLRPRRVHTSTKDGLTNGLLHQAWQQRPIHVWIKCLRRKLRHSTAENPIFLQATHRRTWK